MKTIGTVRRSSCVEAELVLASGAYLTFRLDHTKAPLLQNLQLIRKARKNQRPHDEVEVTTGEMRVARQAAFAAILEHRSKMRLHEPPRSDAGRQLRLPL